MWRQGLFGCFDNPALSMVACCAWPLTIGKNAEIIGENSPVLWAIAVSVSPCVAGALLRGMIRQKKNIEGTFWIDCGVWCCVPCCAICQEATETESVNYLVQPEMQSMNRQMATTTTTTTTTTKHEPENIL